MYVNDLLIEKLVVLLLRNGANIDAVENLWGATPLFHAIAHGQIKMVELLTQPADQQYKACNIEKEDAKRRKPIYYAVIFERSSILMLLYNLVGCDVNDTNEHGFNALLYKAIRTSNLNLVKRVCTMPAIKQLLLEKEHVQKQAVDLAQVFKMDHIFGYLKTFYDQYSSTTQQAASLLRQAEQNEEKKENVFYNMVLQGGGVRGLAYIGAMEEMERQGILLKNFKRIGGTSSGAITAAFLALGYTVEEVKEQIGSQNLLNFFDEKHMFEGVDLKDGKRAFWTILRRGGYSRLKNEYGLFPGKYFRDWLDDRIKEKTGIKNTTFQELQQLNKPEMKELYLMVTNISTSRTEICSHEHTPNLVIADAVRISMSIPVIFAPWKMYLKDAKSPEPYPDPRNHLFVDGGITDNYAVWMFDQKRYLVRESFFEETMDEEDDAADEPWDQFVVNPQTLGFRLVTQSLKQFYTSNNLTLDEKSRLLQLKTEPSNFIYYMYQVFNSLYTHEESRHNHTQYDRMRTVTRRLLLEWRVTAQLASEVILPLPIPPNYIIPPVWPCIRATIFCTLLTPTTIACAPSICSLESFQHLQAMV